MNSDRHNRLFNNRKPIFWTEQPELWNAPDRQAKAMKEEAVEEVEHDLVARASSLMTRFTGRREPVKVREPEATTDVFAERGKSVRMVDIAKFLQVNHAVDGATDAGTRFSLPRGSFSARCSLWRGAPVGNNFMMGC